MAMAGKMHPVALPILRCLPDRVSGTPISRESFAFSLDIPIARFHENDSPGIIFFLLIVAAYFAKQGNVKPRIRG